MNRAPFGASARDVCPSHGWRQAQDECPRRLSERFQIASIARRRPPSILEIVSSVGADSRSPEARRPPAIQGPVTIILIANGVRPGRMSSTNAERLGVASRPAGDGRMSWESSPDLVLALTPRLRRKLAPGKGWPCYRSKKGGREGCSS